MNKRVKDCGLPLLIYLIGLGVVLRYALVDFTFVSDQAREFSVYELAIETGKWQAIAGYELMSSCLWSSYIPAMFQRLFNTDIIMTYKLFPCFIFPTLPVIVYYLARQIVSPSYAFLASAFIMVQIRFLWFPAGARVGVSLVFFSLALLVIFSESLRFRTKAMLLMVLVPCLITSHYATTYITLFLFSITCIVLVIWRQITKTHYRHLRTFLVFVGALVVVVVVWHGVLNPVTLGYGKRVVGETVELKTYVVDTPKETTAPEETSTVDTPEGTITPEETSIPEKGEDTYGYWSLGTREEVIQVAFGKTLPVMNIPQKIEFGVTWSAILIMSWGLALAVRRWGLKNEKVVLMLICYLTIVFSVIVPTIGVRYGIARVHFHMMVLLSVCFAVGCKDVTDRLKIPRGILGIVILTVFGLCTSGLMHNMFGLAR